MTVPFSVSKVLSRVTAALWPTESLAASSAGKGTFSSMVSLSRRVATVWPAFTSSPTSTSRVYTRPAAGAVTLSLLCSSSWLA